MANVNQTLRAVEAFFSAGNEVEANEFPDFLKTVSQALASIEEGESTSSSTDQVAVPTPKPKTSKKKPKPTQTESTHPFVNPATAKSNKAKPDTQKEEAKEEPKEIKPFLPIDQSYTGDSVTCLICGFTKKFIKGHLKDEHKLTPNKYRKMFKLPDDHPITAPNYSEARKKSAVDNNLAEKMQIARDKKKAKKTATTPSTSIAPSTDSNQEEQNSSSSSSEYKPVDKSKTNAMPRPDFSKLGNPDEHL